MMKGKLDKNGFLHLVRKGKMITVNCPYRQGTPCGDWCALFEEPVKSSDTDEKGSTKTIWILSLCRQIYNFEEFVDEREGKEG